MKQSKITKSARGEDCQVRIPNICNFDSSTTVFAHLSGGGIGIKVNDIHGAYCCSSCHDYIDGRTKTKHDKKEIKLWHLEGVIRTQNILLKKFLLTY